MRHIRTAQRVSRGVQTDHPALVVSTGVQTSPPTMPELIDLEPDFDLGAFFFEEMKIDLDDDDTVVEPGTLYQAPLQPFPPIVAQRFQAMDLDEESDEEEEDTGRMRRRRGQDDDFTHTRASTSAGLTRPFRSLGSNHSEASTSSSSTTEVQTDSPPYLTTIGTQTDLALLNRNPTFDLRISGVVNQSFPELDMHSALLPAASLVLPNLIVSYERFQGGNMYLVQVVPRFPYVWLTSDFIHSTYPGLVDSFLRSNPNYHSSDSNDDDSGTASDGNSSDRGSNHEMDIKTDEEGSRIGFNTDDEPYDSDTTDELLTISS